MNFIKLTMAFSTGFNGTPIYMNVNHIEAIRSCDDATVVFVTGDNNAKYYVKESPEAIMTIIKNVVRGYSNENNND